LWTLKESYIKCIGSRLDKYIPKFSESISLTKYYEANESLSDFFFVSGELNGYMFSVCTRKLQPIKYSKVFTENEIYELTIKKFLEARI